MALITDIGASNADSYVTLAYANTYFNQRLGSNVWIEASDTDKEKALRQAAQMLDANFDWVGEIADDVQSMRWPREWATDRDGRDIENDEIPVPLQQAQCEMAKQLLADGGYSADVRDVDRVRLGSILVDFDDTAASVPVSNVVIELLRGLGTYKGSGKGANLSVPTYRV